MRSLDRLEQQRRVKKQNKATQPPPEWEMEEELEFPRFLPLNRTKSAFDNGADQTFGGINTEKSVFDKTAVFHSD